MMQAPGSTMLFADVRGLRIPIFPRLVNLGIDSFDRIASAIDQLPRAKKEWTKIPVLVQQKPYLDFLSLLTGHDLHDIVCYLNDFMHDQQFCEQTADRLDALDELQNTGDLRFHALTLYILVRAARPTLMIETGVAAGKSSSFILLAMEHNHQGKLISIDKPPDGKLADGAKTTLSGKPTGWLVPDYLRPRWTLLIGDSLQILPQVLSEEVAGPDVFLHDSLHTEEHARAEFDLIRAARDRQKTLYLCDNIDMGAGIAFHKLIEHTSAVGFAFRDFAGCWMTP